MSYFLISSHSRNNNKNKILSLNTDKCDNDVKTTFYFEFWVFFVCVFLFFR